MSLRWRWTLTLAGVAAVAIGMAISATTYTAHRQLQDQVDMELRHRIAMLEHELTGMGSPGRGLMGNPLRQFDSILQLIDADGEPRFWWSDGTQLPVDETDRRIAAEGGEPRIRTIEINDQTMRMITAPLPDRGLTVTNLARRWAGQTSLTAVQIAITIDREQAALAGLRSQMILVGLVGVWAVALTGWWLARRAVRPIEELAGAAEEIARTENLAADLQTEAPGEIGRLSQAFSTMLTSLRTSREQQQRLVSDAGHEFRTPLTALKTNLETLGRSSNKLTAPQRRELIAAALSEADELTHLSTELIDLATDIRHAYEDPVEVDLAEVVEAAAARYVSRHPGRIEVVGTGSTVVARRSQLERAVGNLVDNALKWSPPDGEIRIRLDGTRIEVRDHGPGIPDADLPHVFERFYRSVEARTKPGSGLGLAIVQHVVAAHGGEVFAYNHSDGGAVVGFRL